MKFVGEAAGVAFERGTALVAIPVFGRHELFVRCLQSVLRHTPVDTPILVADDGTRDPASITFLQQLENSAVLEHQVFVVTWPVNVGFVKTVNRVFAMTSAADVVVLNSDCEVGPEWVPRLRDAAYSDGAIATASALTNHGTIVSVPIRNGPTSGMPSGHGTESAARAIAELSLQIRPRIPTAVGHCFFIKRAAIELCGNFDEAFSPGYGEEVDFSQRCLLRGMVHIAADDVFVFHNGGGTFGSGEFQQRLKADHEQLIHQRYPFYERSVSTASTRTTGPLARSISRARMALEGLSVTIDASCLGPDITGTQVHVIELIHALARTEQVALRVMVPRSINDRFRSSLSSLPAVETAFNDSREEVARRSTLVHRPFQFFNVSELDQIAVFGERLVVTHQDLLAYRNPGYSMSPGDWDEFRRLTKLSLAVADRIIFFSAHAAADAVLEDLVDSHRTSVVHVGVDHQAWEPPDSARPDRVPAAWAGRFLLCLGTDFRHKNRPFALRVFEELRRRHGWDGKLVFAGPHASFGTSVAEEAEVLALHADAAGDVLDVGPVSEAEKRWLLEGTVGVLYPSVYEGFGLVPFEAAAHGSPCFFARTTSLVELFPPEAETLVPWDAAASADRIAKLLGDPSLRRQLVDLVRSSGARLTWDNTAKAVLDVYEQTIREPYRDVPELVAEPSVMSSLVTREVLASDIVDMNVPVDVLTALRAVAARPRLSRPFYGALRAGYRVGTFVRPRR